MECDFLHVMDVLIDIVAIILIIFFIILLCALISEINTMYKLDKQKDIENKQ